MLELRNVSKRYGKTQAVKDLNLTCADGEFVVIFGPAGAGKSTILRLIAGISPLTKGEIWYNGQNLSGLPPEHRNMAMAFENYALYSHLTVFDNLAFPLRARKCDRAQIKKQVERMAELLQITPLLSRRPGYMSGGQRQRVALGRALIREADVYLLDEPISHLDAKLRHHMRGELKAMCANWDSTVVYVTHDYKEAMALSDRIAVLNKGRLMQVDTPDKVYHKPAHEFVASYLGDPPMSFLDAELCSDDGMSYLQSKELRIPITPTIAGKLSHKSDTGTVRLGIRATDLSVSPTGDETCTVAAEVYVVETFGYRNIVTCRCGSTDIVQSVCSPEINLRVGDTVYLNLSCERVHVFAPDGTAISHPVRNE